MSQLNEAILSSAQSMPEGHILSPKAFLHLGSRAAVDQALTRLTQSGKLMRVGRGAYVTPVSGRFGRRSPSAESIIATLEQQTGQPITNNGAAAANALGLTTQQPTREVFLTNGRSQILKLGARVIEIKHAPGWQLALGKRPAGMAVRALSWLGQEHAHTTLKILRSKLAGEEWEAMLAIQSALPGWMAKAVGEVNAHG